MLDCEAGRTEEDPDKQGCRSALRKLFGFNVMFVGVSAFMLTTLALVAMLAKAERKTQLVIRVR